MDSTTTENPLLSAAHSQVCDARTLALTSAGMEETCRIKQRYCTQHQKPRQEKPKRRRRGAPVDPIWELSERLETFHFEEPHKKPNKKGATVRFADDVVTDVKVVSRWQRQTETFCPHPDHDIGPRQTEHENPQSFIGNPLNPANWATGSQVQYNAYVV